MWTNVNPVAPTLLIDGVFGVGTFNTCGYIQLIYFLNLCLVPLSKEVKLISEV